MSSRINFNTVLLLLFPHPLLIPPTMKCFKKSFPASINFPSINMSHTRINSVKIIELFY